MRILTMSLTAAVALSLLLVTGCAVNKTRDLVARGSAAEGKSWGGTILLCEVDIPATTGDAREKIAKITAQVEQALASTPGATPIPASALLSRLPGRTPWAAGDGELAGAALDAGADTVVLVQVLGYGGELTVSLLPPFWATGTDYAYHARVIDARTGALYLDAHRGLKKGGPFSAHGARELGEDFTADLAALFGGLGRGDAVKNGADSRQNRKDTI